MLGIGRGGPLGDALPADDALTASRSPAFSGTAAAPAAIEAAERDAWVVLAGVHGVGPVSFERLVGSFGSVVAVLGEAASQGAVSRLIAASYGPGGESPTLTAEAARGIVAAAADIDRRLAVVRASGVIVVTLADEAYPTRLRRIELPPPVLFVRGEVEALDRARAIAVVGTRRPTEAGRSLAGQIADAVAGLGATVISGLAVGIDAAAHESAVRAGRPTVAVIGGGHERLYPAANRGLAASIVGGGGVVVSEFAPDTEPSRGTFPRRNRIISGLADATVVVEAGSRSGALTTAAWALEQGRGLHLVPGRVGDPTVAGCLAFLREAAPEARIVAGVAELIEDLGLLELSAGSHAAATGDHQLTIDALMGSLGPAERALAAALATGSASVDELMIATASPGAAVLGALTSLELRGLVFEAFGRYRAAGQLAAAHGPGAMARTRQGGPTGRAA